SVMANLLNILLCASFLPSFVVDSCRSPEELPFAVCAQVFTDRNCSSEHWNVLIGEFIPRMYQWHRQHHSGNQFRPGNWIPIPYWNDQISSAVVKKDCHFIGYEHNNFGGRNVTYNSGIVADMKLDGHNDFISSMSCHCKKADVTGPMVTAAPADVTGPMVTAAPETTNTSV
ncbi:unnamed protein product, partial [Meganyctiphanes norvegica]